MCRTYMLNKFQIDILNLLYDFSFTIPFIQDIPCIPGLYLGIENVIDTYIETTHCFYLNLEMCQTKFT